MNFYRTLMNGSYGLVEIKLGGETLIKDGVATLVELAGKIDTELLSEAQIYFLTILRWAWGERPLCRLKKRLKVGRSGKCILSAIS